ncbi:Odorant receptor [Nesidiocoris tenuis]|uniref:Odorant receptor n=1 Tax=Nesidiocoris tenuis TaxID=355587 RepID=A0ABN7AI01_9HEMI|nr:Odorant receptor [Nesidiocoris tenuis]
MSWLTESDWKLIFTVKNHINYTGLWSERKHVWYLQKFYLLVIITLIILSSYSVYAFKDRIELVTQIIHHVVLATTDLVWISIMNSRQNMKELLDDAVTTYEYHSKLIRDFIRIRMDERLKLLKWFHPIGTVISVLTILSLHVFFVLEVKIFRTYKTLFPIEVPVGDLDNWFIYGYIFFCQETIILFTLFMANGTAAFAFFSWNHLSLELETLCFAIAHVEDLVKEKLSDHKFTDRRSKEILSLQIYDFYVYHFAKHHAHICRYFEILQDTVAVMIFNFFLGALISYACVGLTLTSDNISVQLKFGFIFLLQNITIYTWCWIAQDMADKSENISMVVGSAPWWKMSKQCKSTLLLIMTRCKKPLALKSCFGTAANNESYTDVLSNAYRIFNVLLQMKYSSH